MAREPQAGDNKPEMPQDYDFDFSEWPFYWLARADRTYLSIMETALGRIGLDIPSWRVLMILHSKQSASVSEISEHSIVKLSTMTKIIQRMQSAGLVEMSQSKKDGRVTIVTITEAGEKAGRECWEEGRRILNRAFEDFTSVEQQVLLALLKKLSTSLGRF